MNQHATPTFIKNAGMPKQRIFIRSCMGIAAILMTSVSACLYAATGLPIGNDTPLQRELDKQTEQTIQQENAANQQGQAASSSISEQAHDEAYRQVQGEAFKQLLQSTAPMTPDQIRALHQVMQASKQVVANPDNIPSRGTSNTIIVDISPGATAPVIRLSRGYVTAVRFLDATGQPWPISAYDIGNSSLFDVHWDQKGNTLFMEANTDYQKSNMMVQLQGLSAPVMLTLIPGQRAMDYRDDLRINAMGPNALAEADMNMPAAADQQLSQVLNGVQPSGTHQVGTSMMDADAFEANDKSGLYLRLPSQMTLLSPAWMSRLNSDDGVQAYKIPLASTIVVMQHGKIAQFTVAGL